MGGGEYREAAHRWAFSSFDRAAARALADSVSSGSEPQVFVRWVRGEVVARYTVQGSVETLGRHPECRCCHAGTPCTCCPIHDMEAPQTVGPKGGGHG